MTSNTVAESEGHPVGRWLLLSTIVLAVILVPFFIWEEAITGWSLNILEGPAGDSVVASVIGGLLAFDVLLPVPSSILSTAAGFRFGLLGGAAVSWVGMTAGCVMAYFIGSRLGHGPTQRLVGARALEHTSAAMKRRALWVLAAFRPVPVLAEASVLLAGLSRMDFGRYLRVTALANLGTSLAYAWVGARSADVGSFLLAFAGALLIPALALLPARWASGATDSGT